MRAKDIKPGELYALKRGRGEYATIEPVVFLAEPTADNLWMPASHHRRKGAPAFVKAGPGSKPQRGHRRMAPDVGYPAVTGPAEHLQEVLLGDFEAATTTFYSRRRDVTYRVITSLTGVVGPWEKAVADQEAARDAERREREAEQRRVDAAIRKSERQIAALAAAGVSAAPHGYDAVRIGADEMDKLLALLPTPKEDKTDA